jgi:hypothetical protein
MGKHYPPINLVIIVQLTCNAHIIYDGKLVVHDASM